MNHLALKGEVSINKMATNKKNKGSLALFNWNILKLNIMERGSPPKLKSKGIRA